VTEKEKVKILWDVSIQTDHVIVVGALGTTPKSLEKKLEESWDNSEHRDTSESCTPGNSTNTQ